MTNELTVLDGIEKGLTFRDEAERGEYMHANRHKARPVRMNAREMRQLFAALRADAEFSGREKPRDPHAGYSLGAIYGRAVRPLIGGLARGLAMPFLTPEDRLRAMGIAPIMGAARESDISFLPALSAIASITITADTTQYYTVPAGHAFLFKGIVGNMLADADFTTGDETIDISVDSTIDGTNWVAVASETTLAGSATDLEAENFLQYEPVTLPPTTVAAGLITAVHTDAAAVNFRVPPDCTVRVVLNVSGTTPVFTNGVFLPFGIWL